jgi:hypothetical protein
MEPADGHINICFSSNVISDRVSERRRGEVASQGLLERISDPSGDVFYRRLSPPGEDFSS